MRSFKGINFCNVIFTLLIRSNDFFFKGLTGRFKCEWIDIISWYWFHNQCSCSRGTIKRYAWEALYKFAMLFWIWIAFFVDVNLQAMWWLRSRWEGPLYVPKKEADYMVVFFQYNLVTNSAISQASIQPLSITPFNYTKNGI